MPPTKTHTRTATKNNSSESENPNRATKDSHDKSKSTSLESKRLQLVANSLTFLGVGDICDNVAEGLHAIVHAACVLSGIATTGRPSHLSPRDLAQSQFSLLITNPSQRRVNWMDEWLDPLRTTQRAHQSVASIFDPELLQKSAALVSLEQTIDTPAVRPSEVELARRYHRAAFVAPGPAMGLSSERDDTDLLEHEPRLQKLLTPTILIEGDNLLSSSEQLYETHLNAPLLYLKWPQNGPSSATNIHRLIRGHTLPTRKEERFAITVRVGLLMEASEEIVTAWFQDPEDAVLADELVYLNPKAEGTSRDYALGEKSQVDGSGFSFPLAFEKAVKDIVSRRYLWQSDPKKAGEILVLGKEQHLRFLKWLSSSWAPSGADCSGHRMVYLSIFHLLVELSGSSVATVKNHRFHLLAYELARLAVIESALEKNRLREQARRSKLLPDCLRLLSKLSTTTGLSYRDIQRKYNKLSSARLRSLIETLHRMELVTDLDGLVYLADDDAEDTLVAKLSVAGAAH